MLSARELVRKLKEGKEDEEKKGDHEVDDESDLGSRKSGSDWRGGTEEIEGKKIQIENQLDQERYQINCLFQQF